MFDFSKESEISKKCVQALEWDIRNSILYKSEDDELPVICDSKILLLFSREATVLRKEIGKDKCELFNPSKKEKHLQYMLDKILEEDWVSEIITFEEDGLFYAKLIDVEDEIALETEQGRSSPDEALFDIVSIFFDI